MLSFWDYTVITTWREGSITYNRVKVVLVFGSDNDKPSNPDSRNLAWMLQWALKTDGDLYFLSQLVCTFNNIVSIFISCLIMFLYAVNSTIMQITKWIRLSVTVLLWLNGMTFIDHFTEKIGSMKLSFYCQSKFYFNKCCVPLLRC